MRSILAGLLDMDSEKRMDFFRNLPEEIDQIPYKTLDTEEKHDYLITASTASASNGPLPSTANGYNRQFKNTTFIETEPKHSLSLLLAPSASTSASQSGIQQDLPIPYSENGKLSSFLRSRSQSRDRLSMANGVLGLELSAVDERLEALNGIKAASSAVNATTSITSSPTTITPASPEIILLNPRAEPAMRAISYVKYALRCAGIIYHIQSPASLTDDLAQDKPSLDALKENLCYPILHCIRVIPSKELEGKSPAASLLNQLRPPLTRAATMGAAAARSSSTPPVRHGGINSGKNKSGKTSDETVRCAEFWVQIIPVFAIEDKQHDPANALKNRERSESVKKRPKSKSRGLSAANIHHHHHHHHHEDSRRCTKLRIRISDESLVDVLRKALSGSASESTDNYAMYATPPPPRHVALPMTKKSSGDETADTSMEEDRGRPLVSRSRSGEKSRSRSQRRRPQHTSSGSSTSASLTKTNGQKASESSSKSSDTDIPSEESTNGNRQPKNGLLEVRLDSEEEAKLGAQNSNNNIKRGFFDFVSAFNLKTRPTAISTAPSSPAAIREDLEPAGNEGNVTSNKKETFVPPAALAPM